MMQHLDVFIPMLAGLYMFLLGMNAPLPPKSFKGSKMTAGIGLVIIMICSALLPGSPKAATTPAELVAESLRKQNTFPMRGDEGLTVMDITTDENNTLVYVYRIEKDFGEAQRLAGEMGDRLEKAACKKDEFLTMLKSGISVEYAYQDENGRAAGKTIIRPRLCHL